MNLLISEILNKATLLKNGKNNPIYFDISQNLQNTFSNPALSEKLTLSIAIAIATNEKNYALKSTIVNHALQHHLSNDDINDILATVAIMNMNNTLYKFKHFINHDEYLKKPSGLKMTSKAKPIFGKITFEILALCISIVNNCQVCTIHHEEKCRELQISTDEIYAAIQLTSTIKSISMMEFL